MAGEPITPEGPITFTHKEVAEALVKAANLHEGIWGLYVEFNIAAGNAGPDEAHVSPTAFVGVTKLGLQKFEKETVLSVDAEKVNPPKERHEKSGRRLPGR